VAGGGGMPQKSDVQLFDIVHSSFTLIVHGKGMWYM